MSKFLLSLSFLEGAGEESDFRKSVIFLISIILVPFILSDIFINGSLDEQNYHKP